MPTKKTAAKLAVAALITGGGLMLAAGPASAETEWGLAGSSAAAPAETEWGLAGGGGAITPAEIEWGFAGGGTVTCGGDRMGLIGPAVPAAW